MGAQRGLGPSLKCQERLVYWKIIIEVNGIMRLVVGAVCSVPPMPRTNYTWDLVVVRNGAFNAQDVQYISNQSADLGVLLDYSNPKVNRVGASQRSNSLLMPSVSPGMSSNT